METTDKFYIYAHINLITGEIFYIGKGKDKRAIETTNRNKWWHNTVNKYGYDILLIEENLSEEKAFELEKNYIKKLGRKDLKQGTLINLTDGGEGTSGMVHSEETRKKISQVQTGKVQSIETRKKRGAANAISNKGKKHSDEAKIKMSAAKLKMSDETKRKIGAAVKGRKMSEETKNKISLTRTGVKRHKYNKTQK